MSDSKPTATELSQAGLQQGRTVGEKLRRQEFIAYQKGLIGAIVLTAAAFAIVAFDLFDSFTASLIIYGLGAIQIFVHLRYFLHLDLKGSRREDLQLVLFTLLLGIIMIGGSLWIVLGMNSRMMPANMPGYGQVQMPPMDGVAPMPGEGHDGMRDMAAPLTEGQESNARPDEPAETGGSAPAGDGGNGGGGGSDENRTGADG